MASWLIHDSAMMLFAELPTEFEQCVSNISVYEGGADFDKILKSHCRNLRDHFWTL